MLIYTDAGHNRKFKFFVITDQFGKVLAHKLHVNRKREKAPELEGIICAIYWAKTRGGKNTILTDYKTAIEVLYREKLPSDLKLRKFQVLIKQLVKETNVNLTWIPRQLNVAGKFLETIPKGKASRDAERMLEYFRGGH